VADADLRTRMDSVGRSIRAEDGLGHAADLIESLGRVATS